MPKRVRILILGLALLLVAGGVGWSVYSRNWPARYRNELDGFFGKGGWEVVSEETKDSLIYSDYVVSYSNPALSGEYPGKFKNWYIRRSGANGEEIWRITDHIYRISRNKYKFRFWKRFSGRQALARELMDISFAIIGDEVMELVREVYPENEAACFSAEMSYEGGNPPKGFYDKLLKQPWFTADTVSAKNYLGSDLYDFLIYIRAYDYKLAKLTGAERADVYAGLERLEGRLLEKYGSGVSFEILIDGEHKVKYGDGEKAG